MSKDVSINFKLLQYPIQISLYEKFTYEQMSQFEECSEISAHLCKILTNLTFKYSSETIVLKKGKVAYSHQQDVRNSRFLFRWKNSPAVRIHTQNLYLLDPISPELYDFIDKSFFVSQVLGVGKANLTLLQKLTNKFKLDTLFLNDGVIGNDCSLDFMNIYQVHIYRGHSLSTNTMFKLKSKEMITVLESNIWYSDLLEQINGWIEGMKWPSSSFNFTNLLNFQFDLFKLAMYHKCSPTQRSEDEAEFTLERKDEQFRKLIVGITNKSVSLDQLR